MSWGKMALSMYKSAKDVAKDPTWLEDEDFRSRLDQCERCDLYNHHSKRCKECGCFMMVKARLAGSHCPIEKW